VGSKRNEWKITKISNSARKAVDSLESNAQKALITHLELLQTKPYQSGIEKIEGKKNIYRSRAGDIRCYFRMIAETKAIEILMVDFRGKIKRKSIQRLKN
jgi:mRNA-degrading endonuclease RelE of RelBE toxin-antitoxin system